MSERSRSIVAGALLGLCVILVVAVVVLNATFWLAFALLLVAWAVVAYASGGRTGYYEVSDDGSLGEYLGRSEPDLESMELTKP